MIFHEEGESMKMYLVAAEVYRQALHHQLNPWIYGNFASSSSENLLNTKKNGSNTPLNLLCYSIADDDYLVLTADNQEELNKLAANFNKEHYKLFPESYKTDGLLITIFYLDLSVGLSFPQLTHSQNMNFLNGIFPSQNEGCVFLYVQEKYNGHLIYVIEKRLQHWVMNQLGEGKWYVISQDELKELAEKNKADNFLDQQLLQPCQHHSDVNNEMPPTKIEVTGEVPPTTVPVSAAALPSPVVTTSIIKQNTKFALQLTIATAMRELTFVGCKPFFLQKLPYWWLGYVATNVSSGLVGGAAFTFFIISNCCSNKEPVFRSAGHSFLVMFSIMGSWQVFNDLLNYMADRGAVSFANEVSIIEWRYALANVLLSLMGGVYFCGMKKLGSPVTTNQALIVSAGSYALVFAEKIVSLMILNPGVLIYTASAAIVELVVTTTTALMMNSVRCLSGFFGGRNSEVNENSPLLGTQPSA